MHDDASDGLLIPWEQLSADALRGVMEEYVSREGTDYGHAEVSFDAKVAAVRRQLERGEVVVLFDPRAGTCNLMPARDVG
ncbi:MAG: YheU family protein [Myxococcota bacterium]